MAGGPKKGASENAHIVLIDETGLQMAPLRRRSWALKGLQPTLRQHVGPRQKVSILGALTLSPKTHKPNLFFQTLPQGSFRNGQVAQFLREMLKHLRGNVIVVWDNGSMHKGPHMRKLLEDFPRLSLAWLPPYAPELNPVEQLWSHLKFGHCANFIPDDLEELDNTAFEFLANAKFDTQLLQSYLKATPLWTPLQNLAG